MFKMIKKNIKKIYKTISQKIKTICLKYVFPTTYFVNSLLPVKNTALFVEIRGNDITSNYRGIIHYLRASYKDIEIKTFFLRLGEGGPIDYYKRCKKLAKAIARSKYVFVDDCSNVISALPIRKRTKVIQTWHGCGALKKFGCEYKGDESYFGNEKIFTVSSENVIKYYTESTGLDDSRIWAIGVPRTDIFYQQKYKEKCDQLRKQFYSANEINPDKKLILYAPTFRKHVEDSEKTRKLDVKYLREILGDEYVILYKSHPVFSGKQSEYNADGFIFDITDSMKIEYAMGICDILVTDYSSLIYEYTLLNKPAYFYAYDIDEYTEERGFYIDYDEMPGPICYTLVELVQNINSKTFNIEKMKAFREKYMNKCDGNSTKRLVDLMLR